MSFHTLITKVPLVGNHWITPDTPTHKSKTFDFFDWDSVLALNELSEPYGNVKYNFVLDMDTFWYDTEVTVLQHLKEMQAVRGSRLYTRIFNTRVLSHPFQPESAVYFGEVFLNGVKYVVSSNRLLYKSASFGSHKRQFPAKNEVVWDMTSGEVFQQLYTNSRKLHSYVLGNSFSRQHFTIRYLKDNYQIYFSQSEIENIVFTKMKDFTLSVSDVRKYAGTYVFEGTSQFKKELFAILEAFAKQNELLILVETLTGSVLTKIDGRVEAAKRSLQEIVQEADEKLNQELKRYLEKEGQAKLPEYHTKKSKKQNEFEFLSSLWKGSR